MDSQERSSQHNVSKDDGFRAEYCDWCRQGNEPIPMVRLHTPNMSECPTCHKSITLVTIVVASRTLGVSRKTIYNWMEKGWVQKACDWRAAKLLFATARSFVPNQKRIPSCELL
jgi:hypothetical protein